MSRLIPAVAHKNAALARQQAGAFQQRCGGPLYSSDVVGEAIQRAQHCGDLVVHPSDIRDHRKNRNALAQQAFNVGERSVGRAEEDGRGGLPSFRLEQAWAHTPSDFFAKTQTKWRYRLRNMMLKLTASNGEPRTASSYKMVKSFPLQ